MIRYRTYSGKGARLALVASLAVVGLLALVAAGYAGRRADREASAYVDGLCTDLSGWEQEVGNIAAATEPGAAETVTRTKLNRAASATAVLADRLGTREVPDVRGSAEAKQSVDRLAADANAARATLTAGARYVRSHGTRGANGAVVALPVGLQMTNVFTEAKATRESLKKIEGPFGRAAE